MYLILCFIIMLITAATSLANCIDLSTTTFTQQQHDFIITGALSLEPTIDRVQRLVPGQIHLCSPTANISSITAGALQTASQAAYDAQVTIDASKATETAEIKTELSTSQFCLTATYAQIASRVATQKAAVQADIDAATNITTAKTALTTLNNRTFAAFEALARCTIGGQRLGFR
jgi:hypothetical protein